jgi:hypothetical protein
MARAEALVCAVTGRAVVRVAAATDPVDALAVGICRWDDGREPA